MRLLASQADGRRVHHQPLHATAASQPESGDQPAAPGASVAGVSRAKACAWTAGICAGLIIAFASIAWAAAAKECPTSDEPYHAMAGWLQFWKGEYRYVCDHPPLWTELAAAIATRPDTLRIDFGTLDTKNLPMDAEAEFRWTVQTLFRTAGNDGVAFVGRFRAVMLGVAAGIAAFLGVVVWRMSRAIGAPPLAASAATILAVGVFCLDPNFLAHAPLMKNDIASAGMLLGLTFGVWLAGQAMSLSRLVMVAVWAGLAVDVKFNGLFFIASAVLLLLLRACMPWTWLLNVGSHKLLVCTSVAGRLAVAALAIGAMAAGTFLIIWLSYGFRYLPTREPGGELNFQEMVMDCQIHHWYAKHPEVPLGTIPTRDEVLAAGDPLSVRIATFANRLHLLPQAFLDGVLNVDTAAQNRGSFLCGTIKNGGTWWYFPFVIAVKTPLATLCCFASAAVVLIAAIARHSKRFPERSIELLNIKLWTSASLALPVMFFLGAAMTANLNLGMRHMLPIFPLLFVTCGLAMAVLYNWKRRLAVVGGLVVLAALSAETISAYPDYIPFFNAAAGGSRGGLRLLSDSNLDWGQALPLVAEWQRKHPDQKLYLAYLGTTDPAFYGIRYTNIAEGYRQGPPIQRLSGPGVIAISSTILQGTYSDIIDGRPTWAGLWQLRPFDVLGGAIYLFHYPPRKEDFLPRGQHLID